MGTNVPEMLFAVFQMEFATITPALISGAIVQRMKFLPFIAFAAMWSVFVYCPLAHWVFQPTGWLAALGVLDFAGGLVVETSSGVSALVLAFWLGPVKQLKPASPHNLPYVLLGAALLWFGESSRSPAS
jgi:Amt family ammonium transporter